MDSYRTLVLCCVWFTLVLAKKPNSGKVDPNNNTLPNSYSEFASEADEEIKDWRDGTLTDKRLYKERAKKEHLNFSTHLTRQKRARLVTISFVKTINKRVVKCTTCAPESMVITRSR